MTAAIGIGLAFLGYTVGLWGVFLVTGKNVGYRQVWGTAWPPVVPGATGSASGATGAGGQPITSSASAGGTLPGSGPSPTTKNATTGSP
jgi:hypothetical protein